MGWFRRSDYAPRGKLWPGKGPRREPGQAGSSRLHRGQGRGQGGESGARAQDYIFLCAGFARPKLLVDATVEDMQAVGATIRVKADDQGFNGVFWVSAYTAQRRRGKITFVSSFLGYTSFAGYSTYSPGKYALRGLRAGHYQITDNLVADFVRLRSNGGVPGNNTLLDAFYLLIGVPIWRMTADATVKKARSSVEADLDQRGHYQ
ncbi:3-ketodihydrosphingosine reductase TSC10 [Kwoniella sp. DSM 27419]